MEQGVKKKERRTLHTLTAGLRKKKKKKKGHAIEKQVMEEVEEEENVAREDI